ncbi:hypothetical protein BKA83DRAFT_4130715 [Pisolithus microcarpus]|nr:hypothetical protein BKA83DRAFT_4130715 [Pisolithus microcarpus]
MLSQQLLGSASDTDSMDFASEGAGQAFLHSEGYHIIDGQFKLLKEIGRGHSSVIYTARNILLGSDVVAKLQDTECGQTLLYEYRIQKALAGGLGIPRVWWLGVDDSAKVLIIDQLGPSLEDCLSQQSSCMFSIGAVIEIALQAICN